MNKQRLTHFETDFVSHLLSRVNHEQSIQDLVRDFQISLSFDLNESGEIVMSGTKRSRIEHSTSNTTIAVSIPVQNTETTTRNGPGDWNIVPIWFFQYGKGMIGIPLEGSTFLNQYGNTVWCWETFARIHGIPWSRELEGQIFYKNAGTLHQMPWSCFFFRSKAIEFYKKQFQEKNPGSFPLFPGTALPFVPPEWNTWKARAQIMRASDWDLSQKYIWDHLNYLGVHLYRYKNAYRFDLDFTNLMREYYQVVKIDTTFSESTEPWFVKNKTYQIRGSHLQNFIKQGATL